jgi:hypothetical protein
VPFAALGHLIVSIGEINQLSSDARKICSPSQAAQGERRFSTVIAPCLPKIGPFHFQPLLLSRTHGDLVLYGVNAAS